MTFQSETAENRPATSNSPLLCPDARGVGEDTMNRGGPRQTSREVAGAVWLALLLLCSALGMPRATMAGEAQLHFGAPDAAVEALKTALKNNDENALVDLFGHDYAKRLVSTDKVAAREGRMRLYQAMEEGVILQRDTADQVVLIIGNNQWPFPIPLVRSGDQWRFYTAAGVEEILNRRIGMDELNAIRVCRAYIAAQQQYAAKIRDASGVRKFAQRLASTNGKRDGLYWDPATANGEESPFGPLVSEYLKGGRTAGEPYFGYHFRVLTAQGNHAPGGRYNYVINGNMIGGFALVAFPASYGESGVMTFLVSHHGKVYQKDLGPHTVAVAREMREYNPDSSWTEVKE